jgi:hypothetical protein
MTGLATGPTAPNATSNNQVATTAFVQNQINQNANAVDITGGNVTVTSVDAAGGNITAKFQHRQLDRARIQWQLVFSIARSQQAKLDSNGNFTTTGNVTGFGTL